MSAPRNDAPRKTSAKSRLFRRALLGVALIVSGFVLVLPRPYHERTFRIDSGGCYVNTTVVEPVGATTTDSAGAFDKTASTGAGRGTVVLLHGLAANRKLMSYLAYGFANLGLRVFVPDLPGHGDTAGPFSAARDEECAENLLRELRSRGMAAPESTILAGHSMGGAIAIRLAARIPVAGVIAISPAPMRAAHGVSADVLLFDNPPPLPPNTEIISGGLEPHQMTANARDLLRPGSDVNSRFEIVPWATHGGLLFRPEVVRLAQDWASRVLRLDDATASAASDRGKAGAAPIVPVGTKVPSRWPLLGCVLGLSGILVVAGPFLREAAGKSASGEIEFAPENPDSRIPLWRATIEILAVGFMAVTVLRYWEPLRIVRVFEADYLAGFLLFSGLALIALHWRAFTNSFDFRNAAALRAIFAAAVLFLLLSAWFELTLTESWLDRARWQRFPLLFLTVLPGLMAEELLVGPLTAKSSWKRPAAGLFYRLLFWLPLVFGILVFHSGEILLVLLAPYMALFSVAHRRGMDIVREVTGSAGAAALFGAILLAGFFLVIFPLL